MSVRRRSSRVRDQAVVPVVNGQARSSKGNSRLVKTYLNGQASSGGGYALVDLGKPKRVSAVTIPTGRGSLEAQVREVLAVQHEILGGQSGRIAVTSQTVFLRNPADLPEAERLLAEAYGEQAPATSYVFQPPCCGAALALETWAIGGKNVRIEHHGPHVLSVSYDGTRWIYCAGLRSSHGTDGVYQQGKEILHKMNGVLAGAGSSFEQVVRTWFYLGDITENEQGGQQRYKEFNRARTDFYKGIEFHCSLTEPNIPQAIYPASTGIGMQGGDLVGSCVALETQRADAFLLPLENPQQTPAYAYHPRFSPHSPKFSRAVALVLNDHITTWVSGTASVVHSVSRHPGDIVRQTLQTIENIEKLIAAQNFGFHGVNNAGATLGDLAKIRVYLKRQEDFAACRAICEKRFGSIPAIYAVADVCRPELLVEIEGVAFSKRLVQPKTQTPGLVGLSEKG